MEFYEFKGVPAYNVSKSAVNAWTVHLAHELKDSGIKVNTKEFGTTGEALALLEQSQPGDWDVLVIDTVDVKRMVEAGRLAELNPSDYPMADIFPEVQSPEFNIIDGKTEAAHLRLPGDRDQMRQFAVISSLNLLRLRLLERVNA